LDYAQARYYASAQGRFTSPDDFLNDTHTPDPASWNLYVYVRNNPLRYTDPEGEKIYVGYLDPETDRKTLVADLNYNYGCNGCVTVDNNGYLQVDTSKVNDDVLKAAEFLTGAITSNTIFFDVRASNNDPDIAFGEGRFIGGSVPLGDGKTKVSARLITLDFADRAQVRGGTQESRDAFVKFIFAHEVAHFYPERIYDPKDIPRKTGPVVDAVNKLQQARGLMLRAQYLTPREKGEMTLVYGTAQRDQKTGQVKVKVNPSATIRWFRDRVGGEGIN
jgi:hypothetical protein